jgi:tetratricopeptide (TPR) repeat protein
MPDGLPRLAPPRAAAAAAPDGFDDPLDFGPPRRSRKPLLLAAAAAGAVGLVAVLVLVVRPALRGGATPATVLQELTTELDRDVYAAYGRAIDKLAKADGRGAALHRLQARAAELALLAALAHAGDKPKLSRGEQLLADIPDSAEKEPALLRARALGALAKGRYREADALLGPEATAPDDLLVLGLRRLLDGKPGEAATVFGNAAAGAPERVLPIYLKARALEETKPTAALAAYQAVLAKNPKHGGARVALLRLSTDPADRRLAAATGLLGELGAAASPGQMAELQVVIGRAEAALGHTDEAIAALNRAVAVSPQGLAANLALGETLLDAGQTQEALTRFRSPGPAALRVPAGKFGTGGALILTGQVDEGMALVQQGMVESPEDPRGPYWSGVAIEGRDPEGAQQGYQTALSKDPRYLPASLRLAALLQRRGKPGDAVKVLADAERAGAPGIALKIAWGEALVAGNDAKQAEQVFRAALALNPKAPAAHAGLAAALEAQGNLAGAAETLQKAVEALPEATGLNERLADTLARAGRKEEALARMQADVANGVATLPGRVKLAALALDLGRLDVARLQLEFVIDRDVMTPGALFNRARLHELEGHVAHAVQDYKRALPFDASPALQLALGRALGQLGRNEEALRALEAAGNTAPARLERGRVLLKGGDLEQALTQLQESVRLDPRQSVPWRLMGDTLDQLGQQDKAAQAWARAVELEPQAFEAHYRLGRFKMDRGKAKEALGHLRTAARAGGDTPRGPWEADLYFQLGYAELAAGSKSGAATALERYLALAPEDAPARPEVERDLGRLKR